jgi:polysaccharide pyruvyl transferase WcaK-like protein
MIQPALKRKRQMKKITFLGNFGQGNLGNESTLRAIMQNLRKALPDVELNCICTGPETTTALHKLKAISIHEIFWKSKAPRNNLLIRLVRKLFVGIPNEMYRWIIASAELRTTDMLIVPGTQLLSDNLTGPWGWPYMVFRWSVAAKLQRCKLLFVSVGVGPLRHYLSRFFVKSSLLLADFRSYRDDASRQYLGSIGLDQTNDPVYPDLAFSLQMPAMSQCRQNEHSNPIIAVGVKDYHGQYGSLPRQSTANQVYRCYIDRMTALLAWLLEHSYTVRLVIGDMSYDNQVIADLQSALKARNVRYKDQQLIAEPIESLEELLNQLSSADIVVSPRFHNIVFSLLLNRPVIAISYHEKFSALLESPGLAAFNVPIDDADASTIIQKFCELQANRDELKRQIGQKTAEYRAALDEQYSHIFKMLDAN